jgi:hypothetical protein
MDNIRNLIFKIIALIFIAFAIVGGIQAYSPVPFWDMWDGYLEFYMKVSAGDLSSWWAQHNEHRIILARIFFWIDLFFFQGEVWFLIIINYILICITAVIYSLAWNEHSSNKYKFFNYFIISWLFSWSQNENLIWGFESQFILAQLLPLTAFYMLHKSVVSEKYSVEYFWGAVIFGVLALGSMANGIIALPLLTILSLFLGVGWRRASIVAIFSILSVWLYLYGFSAPAGHGSLMQTLKENPIGMFEFILVYIGGPFYYFVNGGAWGIIIAKIAGAIFILGSIGFAWRAVTSSKIPTLEFAMLFFIIYIGGTAFGTAGGRLTFGIEQAVASRYMTPALMAWASLAVLCAPLFKSGIRWMIGAFLILLLMLPHQVTALRSQHDLLYQRNLAALAIELGVKDQPQISNLWFNADATLAVAERAREQNLSIFGMKPLAKLRDRIGRSTESDSNEARICVGHLDSTIEISKEKRFIKISGWIYDEKNNSELNKILSIVDGGGKIVGFALAGLRRDDVGIAINKNARESGFTGYLLSETQGSELTVVDENSICRMEIKVPVIPYELLSLDSLENIVSVTNSDIIEGNEWMGKDYKKSSFPGMSIYGTYINSDADRGSITIQIKRGDSLLYRSGPTIGRQFLQVIDWDSPPLVLPIAQDWHVLELSNSKLPYSFKIRISDFGDNWGEWSAIALKDGDIK